MTGQEKPPMPAVPRDQDEASASELVPFKSKKINLLKSPLLLMGIITAIVAPMTFLIMGDFGSAQTGQEMFDLFKKQAILAVFFILMLLLFVVYFYARPSRPLWHYIAAFAVVAAITWSPLFFYLAFPFRNIIPGIMEMGFDQQSVVNAWIGMFFIAGLTEEWIKAIPALVCLYAAFRIRSNPNEANGIFGKLALTGPLDGLMIGFFTGAGFILAETAGQYVPNMFVDVVNQSGSIEGGMAAGLSLLFPRVFGGLTGHMGWSAIVCYFIGLAAIRPAKWWKLVLIGWLGASAMHATWNSVGSSYPVSTYLIGGAGVLFAVAALLKSRQLDAASGGSVQETGGSIIVERAPSAQPAPAAAPIAPAPQVASAPAKPEGPIMLNVNGVMLPLRAGEGLNFSDEPALGGKGAGVSGTVVPHPTRKNVLGLRNSGNSAWTARLRDGSKQVIDSGQNVRLAPGVSINFGDGLIGSVEAAG